MYFTSGGDRAFEQLMQQRPGADHFDSGDAGAPEDCGEPDLMEHSDELTFAEYFKSRYDLFRGLITFVVAMQWLIDHDFAEPTDRDARLMDIEVSRQMCDVWGELYVLTLREWLDGQ